MKSTPTVKANNWIRRVPTEDMNSNRRSIIFDQPIERYFIHCNTYSKTIRKATVEDLSLFLGFRPTRQELEQRNILSKDPPPTSTATPPNVPRRVTVTADTATDKVAKPLPAIPLNRNSSKLGLSNSASSSGSAIDDRDDTVEDDEVIKKLIEQPKKGSSVIRMVSDVP